MKPLLLTASFTHKIPRNSGDLYFEHRLSFDELNSVYSKPLIYSDSAEVFALSEVVNISSYADIMPFETLATVEALIVNTQNNGISDTFGTMEAITWAIQ